MTPPATLEARALDAVGELEGAALAARVDLVWHDLIEALDDLYGDRHELTSLVDGLLDVALDAAAARRPELRRRDRVREVDTRWFQRARHVGYACYADRFAGTLDGVSQRLDYLQELGVTYLHLMPLLQPREGESDGGYAVADYRRVDARLGSMADLERLAAELHRRDMNLCLDLVLNHTAAEHEWARRARAGETDYRELYLTFPDRAEPDAYERTLPEVFPATAPGNFTWDDGLGRWVWTTFHPCQWDLDYRNPRTFAAMLETMLFLANRGVDVLRLDAVPFTWKELGTNCQNRPGAHRLLQAFRALVRIAAPGVAFKAEAIVAPDDLTAYLGAHPSGDRPECDLAYHNQLMVLLWSTAATRDVTLARRALGAMRAVPDTTAWISYLRCHDDIGWAIADEDAAAVGLDPVAHRRFLADFYAGRYEGSFARGADFQRDPVTGDVRTSGMAASLAGVDEALALGDEGRLNDGVRRLLLLYSVVFSYGGVPLIWMGDEIALPNAVDVGAVERDGRWLHRPAMDWTAVERRHDPRALEGLVFPAFQRLAQARQGLVSLRAGSAPQLLESGSRHVLAYVRRHPRGGAVLVLANFAEQRQRLPLTLFGALGGGEPAVVAASEPPDLGPDTIGLAGLGWAWLTASG